MCFKWKHRRENYHSPLTSSPKLNWGLPTSILMIEGSWLPWVGCKASRQPSDVSTQPTFSNSSSNRKVIHAITHKAFMSTKIAADWTLVVYMKMFDFQQTVKSSFSSLLCLNIQAPAPVCISGKLSRLGEGWIIPHITGFVLLGVHLIVSKGNYWALAKACTLLSDLLVILVSLHNIFT